jgi:hypothetical protein
MRSRANRDDMPVADPTAYWRRRFGILGVAIAVSAVLALRFGSAHPAPSAVVSAAARSGVTASSSAAAREAAAPFC